MFRHHLVAILALLSLFAWGNPLSAQELKGKKVFFINSYHPGYSWSDGIQQSIQTILEPAGVELMTAYLDTYREKSDEHLAKAATECQKVIEEWKPNVVIVSDDPAFKAVYAEYNKDKSTPFVFCGVNWDAASYGTPGKNITGMLEVCPVKDLIEEMNKLKPGKRIGYLSSDALTPKKDWENSARILGVKLEPVFARNFNAWKQGFQDLQSSMDLLLIGVNLGIDDWDEAEARRFVEANTRVVTGSWHDYLNGLTLVAFNKLASEQGAWAAQAVIQILKGTPPASIPVAANQKGELVLNARLAKKAGITPPPDMVQEAKVIE